MRLAPDFLMPFAARSRNRRLARDFERHYRIAAAFVRMAMIRIMLRRLAVQHSNQIRTFRVGS